MIDLPAPRLVVDHVPVDARPWVERALVSPLNRFLQPLTDSLKRIFISQLNIQVLEYRGFPPTTSLPADFPSTLTGPCVGLIPLSARVLESNGNLGAVVGALTSPVWTEVVKSGANGSTLRVTSQATLTSSTRYFLRWIAVGT